MKLRPVQTQKKLLGPHPSKFSKTKEPNLMKPSSPYIAKQQKDAFAKIIDKTSLKRGVKIFKSRKSGFRYFRDSCTRRFE